MQTLSYQFDFVPSASMEDLIVNNSICTNSYTPLYVGRIYVLLKQGNLASQLLKPACVTYHFHLLTDLKIHLSFLYHVYVEPRQLES